MKYDSFAEGVGYFVTGACILFLLSLIFVLPVMLLWNSTLPELFGVKEINWWMAWKITMLCAILFRSFSIGSK